ncbi:MAG TPA: aromatic ring-hydroxylating dioxygenase subunit alpha [Solirubrobacteraceae bacterium]|nr:aromatic ring-hydroxylating dioxygenase subunit alpha [Solirubrobacteraceae bacterium]
MSDSALVLRAALAERVPGYALPRAFHVEQAIFAREVTTIWRTSWLFAGLSASVAKPGEFFTFEMAEDSVIVVRTASGGLEALHNVCRHRGMRICQRAAGEASRWVCPYHQWTYALDGALERCGAMEEPLERSGLGLRKAHVAEAGGLIFVCLDEPSGPFDEAARALRSALVPAGLERAKVAHEIDYQVAANWKLVWHNNRECWHCHSGHPQYVLANFDAAPATAQWRELAQSRASEHERAMGDAGGAADEHAAPGLYAFPAPDRWWSANRTPLAPGFVTESIDGEAVAPLMGRYAEHDVGTLRIRAVPNFWCHASADHAVLTQLAPRSPHETAIRVRWLVDRDAVEGVDYELERLLPFWQLTSEQDWDLCERNHAGVRSPAFVPGPYAPSREYNVAAFDDWYVRRMFAANERA